jgi:hypothetical protein
MMTSWLRRLGSALGGQTRQFELLSAPVLARVLVIVCVGGMVFGLLSLIKQEPAAKRAGMGI